MRASIIGGLILLCGAISTPALAEDGGYRIGANDVLTVEVYDEPAMSSDVEVSSSGTVSMPLIESVVVRGLTTDQAASLLSEKYLDGILNNPQITVRVKEHRSQQVEVYGAVKTPGVYHLEGQTTLRSMLGMAGWIDTKKSSNQVLVTRTTGERITVGVEDLVTGGGTDIFVLPGDVVSVVEGEEVYVGGEVEKAGSVPFSEGLTVMQALLKVGGPNETARLKGAYIIRDGEKIPVNLRRITDGRESDVQLLPGDQLFLKESPI